MDVYAVDECLPGACYDFVNDDSRFPALVAGFGAGKTHHFIRKSLRAMEDNLGLMGPSNPALLFEPTYPMVEDILVPQFREVLQMYEMKHTYNIQSHRLIIPNFLGHGPAHLKFLSAENYERYRGWNIPFFGIDEVDTIRSDKAKAMWTIFTSRLRMNGSTRQGFVSTTPEGFRFLWSKWAPRNLKTDWHKANYVLHKASSRDNFYLPPDYVPDLERDYDPRLIKAYIEGEFVNLTQGAIYEQYSPDIHLQKAIRYNPRRPLHLFFDFNVNPMSAGAAHIIYFKNRLPEVRVISEHIIPTSNTKIACEALLDRYHGHMSTVFVYGDATGKRKQSSSGGESDIFIIDENIGKWFERRFGYENRFTTSNPRQRDRYASTNAMFLNSAGLHRLFAHPDCETLSGDWLAMSFKEGSVEPDTQGEKIGHISSALDYFLYWHWPQRKRIEGRIGRRTAKF